MLILGPLDIKIPELVASRSNIRLRNSAILIPTAFLKRLADIILNLANLYIIASGLNQLLTVLAHYASKPILDIPEQLLVLLVDMEDEVLKRRADLLLLPRAF